MRAVRRPVRQGLALSVLCVGLVLVMVDGNIMIVALNAVKRDLDLSTGLLAWAVDAYLVTSGGVLLVAGAIGDAVGRRRVFVAGLVVFTLASAVCGLATSGAALVIGRLVQGVGAGLMLGVLVGMVTALHADAEGKARAIRLYGFVVSVGAAAGLALSGVMTDLTGWRVMFLINVPIGVLAVIVSVTVLERPVRHSAARIDVRGAILATSGLLLGLFALVDGPERGWTSWSTVVSGGAALTLLAAFGVRQAREERPLLPRELLRSRSVRRGMVGLGLLTFGQAGLYFAGVLFLQRVLGYSAAATAWATLPLPIVLMLVMPLRLERLQRRVGRVGLLGIGLAGLALGLGWLAQATTGEASYVPDVLPAMLLVGLGVGLAYPRGLALAMAGTTDADAGVASGLSNAAQNVSSSIGVALAATAAAATTGALRGAGWEEQRGLSYGYGVGLAAVGVVVAVCAGLAIGRSRREA
jgi:EmrB/QacA subfamily drug resistance transporter